MKFVLKFSESWLNYDSTKVDISGVNDDHDGDFDRGDDDDDKQNRFFWLVEL